jgi:ferredoxin-fold anticodon binding domain-containing protein
MNPAIYIPIIVLWMIIFMSWRNKKKAAAIRKMIEKRKNGGNKEMKALAEKFIGKDCVIYSFDSSHQFDGVIKEVADGAILIEKDGKLEAINLDFVIRIREYPLNKKGKKVSVVMD